VAPTINVMLTKERIVCCKKNSLKVSRNAQPSCVDGANGSFISHAIEMYFTNNDKWYLGN